MAHRGTKSILHFSYQKTSGEIFEKVQVKAEAVKSKIAEREQRISDLRKAHDISDQDLIQIYAQAAQAAREGQHRNTYSIRTNAVAASGSEPEERIIGAGVVQNFLSESGLIETEKEDLKKLESIKRNLRPLVQFSTDTGAQYTDDFFTLNEEDLEYLGF